MPSINKVSTSSSGVKALCSELGYSDVQDKESPRHFTRLATPLRQFRRIHKAYDVPRCALEFCQQDEKKRYFFASSRKARANGWPVLPDDKDQYCPPPISRYLSNNLSIIEKITKIIFIQESNSRETENY